MSMFVRGEEFVEWLSNPSKERKAAYRARGVRFRTIGNALRNGGRCPVLFVHCMDIEEAAAIDATADQS